MLHIYNTNTALLCIAVYCIAPIHYNALALHLSHER